MKQLLVVVDYQTDFVTGALGFAAAEALEDGIAAAVEDTLAQGGYVLFTRDTHGADYPATREGRHIPVAHCLVGTPGHGLHGRLHAYQLQPHAHVAVQDKPTFGDAALPGAVRRLCGGAPNAITLCGVVTDICVVANALLLHSAFLDADIALRCDLCASPSPGAEAAACTVLAGMGIGLLNGPESSAT